MKAYHAVVAAAAAVIASSGASAATNLYTNAIAFGVDAPIVVVLENFEDSPVALRNMPLPGYIGPSGTVSFVGMDGTPFPNVFLAPPGFTNFGAGNNPTTSVILTANGNEGFQGTLATPTSALGFNVFLNDSPFTVTFLSGAATLGTITYDDPVVPGNNLGFAGATSTDAITGFRVAAINGGVINTGVDNIVASPVPEPAAWAMMLFGFGAAGAALRSARRNAAKVAFSR